MKKLLTMMAMMLAMMTVCGTFSSCGDDDDDSKAVAAAELISGSYKDSLSTTVMGQTSKDTAEIKIEKVDDQTINVVLPSSGSGMMALPSITVPNMKVSGSNGSYKFGVTDYKGSLVNNQGVTKEFTVTMEGTVVNNKLTLNYKLQYGSMPVPMISEFVANKK